MKFKREKFIKNLILPLVLVGLLNCSKDIPSEDIDKNQINRKKPLDEKRNETKKENPESEESRYSPATINAPDLLIDDKVLLKDEKEENDPVDLHESYIQRLEDYLKNSKSLLTSENVECGLQVLNAETLSIIGKFHKAHKDYLKGTITQSNHQIELQKIAGSLTDKSKLIEGALAGSLFESLANFKLSLLLRLKDKKDFSVLQKNILIDGELNVEKITENLILELPYFTRDLEILEKHGFFLNENGEWNASELKINQEVVLHNRDLQLALARLVSQDFLAVFVTGKLKVAQTIGNWVVMPGIKPDGFHTTLEINDYRKSVSFALNSLDRESKSMINALSKVHTYKNRMTGRLRKKRGYKGKTAPEIELKAARELVDFWVLRLVNYYGVPRDSQKNILTFWKGLSKIESQYSAKGIAELKAGLTLAIATPVVAALWFAPSLGSVSLGTMATMAALPVIFSTATLGIKAGISTRLRGGNFWCHFKNDSFLYSANAISLGLGLSLLPMVSSGIIGQGVTHLKNASTGAIAVKTFDSAIALSFIGLGTFGAVKGVKRCRSLLQAAEIAEKIEDEIEIANALSAEAYGECAQAGIDLSFAMLAGKSIYNSHRFRSSTKKEKIIESEESSSTNTLKGNAADETGYLYKWWKGVTEEEAIRINSKTISKLNSEGKKAVNLNDSRLTEIDSKEAARLLKLVKNNVVTGNTSKYDKDGNTGFCFGRAMAVHLEALSSRVNKKQIRKVWVVGKMKNGIDWGFHVATTIKAKEGGWWVIDPYLNKPMKVEDWLSFFRKFESDGEFLRLYVTSAKRFSVDSPAPYKKASLENPFYNNYFVDYLNNYRARVTQKSD